MPLELILNLILVFSALGILVVFLRRLPEILEQQGQLRIAQLDDPHPAPKRTLSEAVSAAWVALVKKVWHFMLEAKDLRQGQALATKFIEIVPSKKTFNIGALSSLKKAERLYAEGNLDESEEAYLAIIKKHPHEFGAYEGLVKIYSQQKKFGEVQQVLEYLVRHNPENDVYLTQLGATLMRRRRFKEAITAYEQALKIHDLVPVRYVNIGLCQEALGNLSQARQNFQKALDLEPANVQYLMILADLILKQGDRQKVENLLSKGLEINPDNAMLKEKLFNIRVVTEVDKRS